MLASRSRLPGRSSCKAYKNTINHNISQLGFHSTYGMYNSNNGWQKVLPIHNQMDISCFCLQCQYPFKHYCCFGEKRTWNTKCTIEARLAKLILECNPRPQNCTGLERAFITYFKILLTIWQICQNC